MGLCSKRVIQFGTHGTIFSLEQILPVPVKQKWSFGTPHRNRRQPLVK